MIKKVVIPTDYSVESLNTLKLLLSNSNENELFDVIMLHGIHQSDSITDLLFFSRDEKLEKLQNERYKAALSQLEKHPQITFIRNDFFSGNNQAAFDNYLHANRVNLVAVPSTYKMKLSKRASFDLIPYVKHAPVETVEVGWYSESSLPSEYVVNQEVLVGIPVHS